MATTLKYDVNEHLVLGEELYLYIAMGAKKEPIAFATSCNLQIDGETIDTSNKMAGKWASNLAGKNGYTITSDALYTQATGLYSFDSLMAQMIKGGNESKVTWYLGKAKDYTGAKNNGTPDFDLDETLSYYTGTAYITSLSLNAGTGEVANCSITLTGSGSITPVAGSVTGA